MEMSLWMSLFMIGLLKSMNPPADDHLELSSRDPLFARMTEETLWTPARS